MSDADALLAAVLADPDADLPRLLFADLLDDTGDAARAEFIRVQCGLAADPTSLPLLAREQTLLGLHREDWLRPLRAKGEPLQNVGTHARFRRGFVEEVWMPAGVFTLRADKLFRRAPVRSLQVTRGTAAELADLVRCPPLGRLRELTVSGRHGDAVAWEVGRRVRAGWRPAALVLRNCGLTTTGVLHLTDNKPPTDWQPAVLDVSHNGLTEQAVGWLRERFGPAVRADP